LYYQGTEKGKYHWEDGGVELSIGDKEGLRIRETNLGEKQNWL
jgi:hypothetical protein